MEFTVSKQESGMLLSVVLAAHAQGVPKWAIREAFNARDVKLDGKRAIRETRVQEGQRVRVYFPKKILDKPKVLNEKDICYEDENIVIINKPQGIPSAVEDENISVYTALTLTEHTLQQRGTVLNLYACHRLDVQTGGLLVFAKTRAAQDAVCSALGAHQIQKSYTCLVKGCPKQKERTLKGYLKKDAANSRVSISNTPVYGSLSIETHYRVLEEGEISRLTVCLITGRTHQIRAHLSHIGHPILGDDKYGDRELNRRMKKDAQCLWATSLVFQMSEGVLSYLNGKSFRVECPF